MIARRSAWPFVLAGVALIGAGCATKPFDYKNFREHRPRSILVLPPLNNSTDVRGTYGYYSTTTRPLAELGYYVFPVALVDEFLKNNGLPGPGEMHQAPLKKIREVFGADSVLYITLEQYGTKYRLLASNTVVQAKGKLVDTRSGITLWEGNVAAQKQSGGGNNGLVGMLVEAAISQAVNSTTDAAHEVSSGANSLLFTGKAPKYGSVPVVGSGGPALLNGPYLPDSDSPK